CISLDEREEVPEAQSEASTRPTFSPRLAASKAAPAPLTPPPTTSTSRGLSAVAERSRSRWSARLVPDRGTGRSSGTVSSSAMSCAGGHGGTVVQHYASLVHKRATLAA